MDHITLVQIYLIGLFSGSLAVLGTVYYLKKKKEKQKAFFTHVFDSHKFAGRLIRYDDNQRTTATTIMSFPLAKLALFSLIRDMTSQTTVSVDRQQGIIYLYSTNTDAKTRIYLRVGRMSRYEVGWECLANDIREECRSRLIMPVPTRIIDNKI